MIRALLSIILLSLGFGFMDLVIWKEFAVAFCFVAGTIILNGGDKL